MADHLHMASSLASAYLDLAKHAFSPFDLIGFREIHDSPRFLNRLQILQSIRQDLPLNLLVKRDPHRVTQGKCYQQRSRRFYFLGDSMVEGY